MSNTGDPENQPTVQRLQQARDEFRDLLASRTAEVEWQRFFSAHPYVFSMSLPLRLEPTDIIPYGRPGRTEPDFIFFQKERSIIPTYGVIEIKRPDSKIVTVTRANTVILSRDAETAIQQARRYAEDMATYVPVLNSVPKLVLGNRSHIFVVMGTSLELTSRLGTQVYRDIVEERLPKNLQLLPYDVLLQAFESVVPPKIFFLVPDTNERVLEMHPTMDPAKLYIGGIAYALTDEALRDAFAQAGLVASAEIIMDKLTGRSKGFGYVTMKSPSDAQWAIEMWNGKELFGRSISVTKAGPIPPREPRRRFLR